MARVRRFRRLRAEQRRFEEVCREIGGAVSLAPPADLYWETRWFVEVVDMRRRLEESKEWHHLLRATTISIGIFIPALVGLNLSGVGSEIVQWSTLGLSILSALSVAASELLRTGERWRINRTFFPALYREGLQFATLSGRYGEFDHHDSAYQLFVNSVESIIQTYEAEYQQQLLIPSLGNTGDARTDVLKASATSR
ncbi:hypothetical protein GCM10010464_82130 [Pseudonocardia yunnanensis]|uniref:DUF4231 domain-containing protein n=1 Tax=Pseudonocardia yunnanensis TaxID=58107 RepID=A0ABW4EUM9_9PSEU